MYTNIVSDKNASTVPDETHQQILIELESKVCIY